ncbi:unnamed protein product, partial [Amoebophrya sp. A120]
YENANLFQLVLELIFKTGFRTKEALKNMDSVFLVLNTDEDRRIATMRRDIVTLTNGFHTFESWGQSDSFSQHDSEKAKNMNAICRRLRHNCSVGGQDTGDTSVPDETAQRNLLDLGLMRAISAAISIPITEFQGEGLNVLKEMMKEVTGLLTMFVYDNKRNQHAAFEHLPTLRTWFNYGVGMANPIASIFRNNRELCEKVPVALIYDFAFALQARSRGFLPHQLAFFHSILVVGDRKINRNADILAEILSKPRFDKVLHCLFDSDGRKKRRSMLRKFASLEELSKPEPFRKWNGDDAELVYSVKSVELLSLICLGQGDGGRSSFVVNMISPDSLTVQYMEVHETVYITTEPVGGQPSISKAAQEMARVLQGAMLDLMSNCYYETEVRDDRFWNSDIHLYLLELLTTEIDKIFNVSAKNRPVTDSEEIFVHRVLRALNNYVQWAMSITEKHGTTHKGILDLCRGRMSGLLKQIQNRELPISKDVFLIENKRLIAWIEGSDAKDQLRIPSGVITGTANKGQQGNRKSSSSSSSDSHHGDLKHSRGRYTRFLSQLKHSPLVKHELQRESDLLIAKMISIDQYTDPTNAQFQSAKKLSMATGQPIGCDYRRIKIKLEDLVDRMVRHCMQIMGEISGMPTILRVYELLNLIIDYCDISSGSTTTNAMYTLVECQTIFTKAGVVRLIIETLMLKPDAHITQKALSLGISMLRPNNETVQQAFTEVFYSTDDSGLWSVFCTIYDQILNNLKPVRTLKKVQRKYEQKRAQVRKERPDLAAQLDEVSDSALTSEEQEYLQIWSEQVESCCKCIEFQQKLSEGHNLTMQNYTYNQHDNSASVNFVEKTVDLFVKLTKSREIVDDLDEEELALACNSLDLIIEVLQGPCARNQVYVSVSGLVEQINKILRWPFANIVDLNDGDQYPDSVRELKYKCCLCLNCLLELRPDTEVHRNIIHRVDISTFQNRVIFAHRYFLSEVLNCGPTNLEAFDEPDTKLKLPNKSPQLVVENFTNDQLQDYFGEAWELIMVMNQLSEADEDFKKAARPNFALAEKQFGPLDFANDSERQTAENARTYAKKFVLAHEFFSRWIKSIEIMVDGNIFDVWFRMPVICDFVLGSAKRDIVNKINFSSPEEKAAEFVEMSEAIFAQTEHTRALSKWEWPMALLVPGPAKRPFNFFLKNDSQNLMRISEYTLYIAVVLNLILGNNMYLADVNDVQGDLHHPIYPILHADAYWSVMAIAWFYQVLMLITSFISICLYSPLDLRKFEEETKVGKNASFFEYVKSTRPLETLLAVLTLIAAVYCFSILYKMHWLASVIAVFFLCGFWDDIWQKPEGHRRNHRCPNNYWAHLIRTVAIAGERRPIWRRVGLSIICWLGIFDAWYFFSFLLLDTMFQYPMLENVLKAVMIPIKSLGLTFLLGMIIMYTYAFVGFYYFRPDFEGACTNIADCTVTTIYQGMRSDIGSALHGVSPSVPNWYERVGYDLSYFIIITTVLMNVIFGIILDTFGSLRDETQQREEYMKNVSFISCLDRSEIEKAASVLENPEIRYPEKNTHPHPFFACQTLDLMHVLHDKLELDGDGCFFLDIRSGFKYVEEQKQNKWNYARQ